MSFCVCKPDSKTYAMNPNTASKKHFRKKISLIGKMFLPLQAKKIKNKR